MVFFLGPQHSARQRALDHPVQPRHLQGHRPQRSGHRHRQSASPSFEREGAYELCSVGDVYRRTTPEAVAASLVRRAGWGRLPNEAPPEDGYSNARSRTLRATFVASKCSSAMSRASRECRP